MEGFLIAGLVMGAAGIIVSFFIKDKGIISKEDKTHLSQEIRDMVFNKENMESLISESKLSLQERLDEMISDKLLKVEDDINETSNQKMIALNEMFENLEVKIDHNHKEVVFLYDMLNQKEEELKALTSQIEGMKKSLHEEEKKLVMTFQYINKKVKIMNEVATEKAKERVKNQRAEKHSESSKRKKIEEKMDVETQVTETENNTMDLNEKIMAMKNAGKTVMEISKELAMGQGEVSLILGLYGRNG